MSAPDTPKDGVLYHTGYPVSAQRDSRVASVLRREENSPWGPFERPVVSSRYRLYPKLRSRVHLGHLMSSPKDGLETLQRPARGG
jgi:hypothetical protein